MEFNEKSFNNLGTSIIIHSVLPTEDDYELAIAPANNIISLDTIGATLTDDINLNECQSITESNTSAEDLTIIETQKQSEIHDDNIQPINKPVDENKEASSSPLEMLEETKTLRNDHLLELSKEEDIVDTQIAERGNIGTIVIDEIIESSVENNQRPETKINQLTSKNDSEEHTKDNNNIIQVVEKENLDDLNFHTESEKLLSRPLEESEDRQENKIEMEPSLVNKNSPIDNNSLFNSEADLTTHAALNDENTAKILISNLLEAEGIERSSKDVIGENVPPCGEEMESFKSELHNTDDEKKNENIKTPGNIYFKISQYK